MKCRFCAEECADGVALCPHCGEATSVKPIVLESLARLRPTREQVQTMIYLVAGLTLALAPFMPGLSFTVAPKLDPDAWRRTVTAAYFQSIVPLVLPLLGLVIVMMGTRRPQHDPGLRRRAALLSAGVATAAVAVWSLVSLFRVGQSGTDAFSGFTFTRSMSIRFGFTAPWVVLLVGVAVTLAVVWNLPRRVPVLSLFALSMVAGGLVGAVAEPLQSADDVLQRASAAVDGYESQVAAEQAAERAQAREDAAYAEDAAIGDCAGMVMGWVVAVAEGRADANQVAFTIGTSSPVVQVIFSTYGTFYSTAAQQGFATALGVATNAAVDDCRDSRVREAAAMAPRAP